MKKLIFFPFLLIVSTGFAQPFNVKIDETSIVKPEVPEVILDPSVSNKLDAFKDNDDAILYIYRVKSMVGAMVKWKIDVDSITIAKLGSKEYVVVHINTTVKNHIIAYPNLQYNYINFKPNKYYIARFKGFTLNTGYLDKEAYDEINKCDRTKALKE